MRSGISALLVVLCLSSFSPAQPEPSRSYSRPNTFSIFTEYSNDSSHIILGVSDNRKLAALGVSYSRRMVTNHVFEWQYGVEIRPLVVLREPTSQFSVVTTFKDGTPPLTSGIGNEPVRRNCTSETLRTSLDPPGIAQTITLVCGSRWTYAGGLSPFGQTVNFAPHHRMQPFIATNAGFLVSPRDIPANDSSRFNFTFEFGAGLELYRDHRHSVAVEYLVHHLSNAYIGDFNPGIDSGIIKLTYSSSRQ